MWKGLRKSPVESANTALNALVDKEKSGLLIADSGSSLQVLVPQLPYGKDWFTVPKTEDDAPYWKEGQHSVLLPETDSIWKVVTVSRVDWEKRGVELLHRVVAEQLGGTLERIHWEYQCIAEGEECTFVLYIVLKARLEEYRSTLAQWGLQCTHFVSPHSIWLDWATAHNAFSKEESVVHIVLTDASCALQVFHAGTLCWSHSYPYGREYLAHCLVEGLLLERSRVDMLLGSEESMREILSEVSGGQGRYEELIGNWSDLIVFSIKADLLLLEEKMFVFPSRCLVTTSFLYGLLQEKMSASYQWATYDTLKGHAELYRSAQEAERRTGGLSLLLKKFQLLSKSDPLITIPESSVETVRTLEKKHEKKSRWWAMLWLLLLVWGVAQGAIVAHIMSLDRSYKALKETQRVDTERLREHKEELRRVEDIFHYKNSSQEVEVLVAMLENLPEGSFVLRRVDCVIGQDIVLEGIVSSYHHIEFLLAQFAAQGRLVAIEKTEKELESGAWSFVLRFWRG